VDAERRPVEDGTVGEIALRGSSLFTGYNLDPDRTARQLAEGVFHTGDLGFRHDGQLFILGRVDDLIIVNGRNLFAHELEAVLADVPGLKPGRAVAVARPNHQTGSADLLVIAERAAPGDDDATRHAIMTTINSIFAVMPKEVGLCDAGWLVKTTSGKISRKANLERYMEAKGKPA
jgi:acyl-CoA synthetase (AMP-forming)/AMP-acid ligase II